MVTLRVHIPSLQQPIEVKQAEVTWRAGDDFGVQFIQLNPDERARLNKVIEDMINGINRSRSHQVRMS